MTDRPKFAPPPLRVGESLVLQVAFRDHRAYAAPIGTSLQNTDAWFRIDSLEALADRLGIDFEAQR